LAVDDVTIVSTCRSKNSRSVHSIKTNLKKRALILS